MSNLSIKVKYFDKEMPKITKIDKGDWIDLRSAIDIEIKAGEYKKIPLGVAFELPEGYEAYMVPRSSTFKNYGIMQINSFAVFDESYKGDNDEWIYQVYAMRDTKINKYDRVAQFRIQEKMPEIEFIEVEKLSDINRGGIGSTGNK